MLIKVLDKVQIAQITCKIENKVKNYDINHLLNYYNKIERLISKYDTDIDDKYYIQYSILCLVISIIRNYIDKIP